MDLLIGKLFRLSLNWTSPSSDFQSAKISAMYYEFEKVGKMSLFKIFHFFISAADIPYRRRKTWKLPVPVSHGNSYIDKHGKHPGDRGNSGGMHHHRINFDKYHPGYFGKVGMRHYLLKRKQSFCPTARLEKLRTLVSEQTQVNTDKNKTGVAAIIDVVQSGYYSVLEKGKVPKQHVIMKAKFYSRRAEEKIKGVREACVLVA
ncbi:60S ribosomal protein L27a-like [Fukomys damarensis]|uniref:60S ribosomal protein L27a-like n=1 Tax=Fukomys damarensis TaxID=885580 RepID=UPI00145526E2|nr:60S ribosomal protein L27a-like [Fukomys damarensis]